MTQMCVHNSSSEHQRRNSHPGFSCMQADLELLQSLSTQLAVCGLPKVAAQFPDKLGLSAMNLQFVASGLLFLTALRKKTNMMSQVCFVWSMLHTLQSPVQQAA